MTTEKTVAAPRCTEQQLVGILDRAALLEQATPERNPVWIEVRGGRIVRSGLIGIDDPEDPKAGMVHANPVVRGATESRTSPPRCSAS